MFFKNTDKENTEYITALILASGLTLGTSFLIRQALNNKLNNLSSVSVPSALSNTSSKSSFDLSQIVGSPKGSYVSKHVNIAKGVEVRLPNGKIKYVKNPTDLFSRYANATLII